MNDFNVKRTERGWIGHYILADRCLFRRNTLLQREDGVNIVVSSVGLLTPLSNHKTTQHKSWEMVGINRYFETMAFHANNDTRYYDADVSHQVYFESPWAISEIDADDKANDMHENVINELTERLNNGEDFKKE